MDVELLAKELFPCNLNCEGILKDLKKGIIPRCLFFEKQKGKNDAIVVGLNPGKANQEDKNYFLRHNGGYNVYENLYYGYPYYKKTRELISLLGFDGNIL